MGQRCFVVFMFDQLCLHSWYRANKLSVYVVFLLLRICSRGKDSFSLPLSSVRIRISSLRSFLSWASILSTWVKSACFAYVLFQLSFYTVHTVYEEAFLVITAVSSKLIISDLLPIWKTWANTLKRLDDFSDWLTSLCYRGLSVSREQELYSVEIWMNRTGIYCPP